MFLTALSLANTVLLALLIMFLLRFKRSIPDIQQVLDDVGASIGDQLAGLFEKPMVKRAMSTLGKKSGEVRANSALRDKAADKLLEGVPSVGFILDQLDLSPTEGLQLLQDPLVGPFIKNAIAGGLKGFKGGGFGGGGSNKASGKSISRIE